MKKPEKIIRRRNEIKIMSGKLDLSIIPRESMDKMEVRVAYYEGGEIDYYLVWYGQEEENEKYEEELRQWEKEELHRAQEKEKARKHSIKLLEGRIKQDQERLSKLKEKG